ncbi:MAG: phosphorylase [Candidatus Accumulibacter sp.]|jgi:ATP adenylyltransferase|nr:phosphorylase [Candidatus Accumulibacter conexus]
MSGCPFPTAQPKAVPGDDGSNAGLLLSPGSLAALVAERTRVAIAAGALHRIDTEQCCADDGGVRFLIRVVSSLRRKAAASSPRGDAARPAVNPFLPPEPELTVGAISRSHLAVLNKFNVLERHLLIVTRDFEDQRNLLGVADFHALYACLAEYPALGFYNGGRIAGASQQHKHLQVVPLPFDGAESGLPMAPLLSGDGPRCPRVPFAHAFGRLPAAVIGQPAQSADVAHALYRLLLADLGIAGELSAAGELQSAPYNLLVAADWMLVVPRCAECWHGISINALAFAGSLFVRDREQLELIRRTGPLSVLQAVAGSGGAAA